MEWEADKKANAAKDVEDVIDAYNALKDEAEQKLADMLTEAVKQADRLIKEKSEHVITIDQLRTQIMLAGGIMKEKVKAILADTKSPTEGIPVQDKGVLPTPQTPQSSTDIYRRCQHCGGLLEPFRTEFMDMAEEVWIEPSKSKHLKIHANGKVSEYTPEPWELRHPGLYAAVIVPEFMKGMTLRIGILEPPNKSQEESPRTT